MDLEKGAISKKIDVRPGSRGVTFSPENMHLFAVIFGRTAKNITPMLRNSITMVERKTGSLVDEIPVGLGPCSISVRKAK